jgi:putative ABC transport system ATP-binding protein
MTDDHKGHGTNGVQRDAMERSRTAVRCRGVTKEFGRGEGRTLALRGVNLDVACGEITLLVGQSGCGKTTLLSVIAGLLEPSSGDVEVLGYNLKTLIGSARVLFRRANLGFAFQQFNLLPALTAVENAAVPLFAAKVSRRKAVQRASELLERLGMGNRLHSLPNQLSGGQQQRVAFARALIHEPRLVVCDEPTSALDAETGRAVMELLADIAVRPDRAVVIVTHDDRIFSFADTIAYVADGQIERVKDCRRDGSPRTTPTSTSHLLAGNLSRPTDFQNV